MGNLYGPSYSVMDPAAGIDVTWLHTQTTDLLASASRAATTNSADQTNTQYRGIILEVPLVSASSSGTILVTLQARLPSGAYSTLLASTSHTTGSAGTSIVLTYSPYTAAVANVSAGGILPYGWRVLMTHATTGAIVYSAHYQLLK